MNPAPRVLIVDDEESIRKLAERVLHRAGYDTAVAADGPEALRIAEAQPPFDLVLADVAMPDMHGDELARRLLRREPDLKILYFTGFSEQLFADRTTLGENEAFLEKPATAIGLVEAVSLMLSGQLQRLRPDVLTDPARSRSVRVEAPALAVSVDGTACRLANLSTTGALVYLPHRLEVGREWTMRIETKPQPVELQVRVVRSHPVSVSLPDVMWQHQEYAVALAFTAFDSATEEVIIRLCAAAFPKHE